TYYAGHSRFSGTAGFLLDMTEAGYAVQRSSPIALPLQRASSRRRLIAAALWAIGGGNAALIAWLWLRGGNVSGVHSTGELLTSLGRLTGLLAAYAALLQVVLLARIRSLEQLVGFDRLTVWHRWNGHA